MPSRAARRRTLALIALSLAVTGAVVAGSGSVTGGTAQARGHLAAARPGVRSGGPVLCRVTPRRGVASRHHLLVALGASFTAGVGAASPSQSWAVRLAELLGWRAVTLGVPGAGYTRAGLSQLGPLASEVRRAGLPALHPSVVIVQAGHDDWRVPPAAEASHVASLVRQLQAQAPGARLVFLTVFSPPDPSTAVARAQAATDRVIVAAIRGADPRAIIIDPLRLHWTFPRAGGGLHPTARGHLLIAGRVARILVRAGVAAAAAGRPAAASVSCTRLGPARTRHQPRPSRPRLTARPGQVSASGLPPRRNAPARVQDRAL
jgi:lysophospholipase L1-like esterase